MKSLRAIAFLPLAALPLAAQADLGLANAFNGFVFGNVDFSSNETEGPLAVGGNFTTTGAHNTNVFSIAGPTIGAKTNVALLVGGNFAAAGGQLQFGNAYVGGNFNTSSPYNLNNANSSFNVGGSITGGVQGVGTSASGLGGGLVPASLFTDQKSLSTGQSSAITGLGADFGNSIGVHVPGPNDQNRFEARNHAGTVIGLGDQNGLNINVGSYTPVTGVGGQSVYVFNVDKSLVGDSANSSLRINWQGLTATSTVLVNVTGGGSINWKIKTGSNNIDRILYNFDGASNVTIGDNDEFYGTVLAPGADVLSTKRINGNLIANNATFVGTELHFGQNGSYRFGGYVPSPVPEPTTWAVLGLGAAAMLRRRRN